MLLFIIIMFIIMLWGLGEGGGAMAALARWYAALMGEGEEVDEDE